MGANWRKTSLAVSLALTVMLCTVDVTGGELPAKPSIKASALYLIDLKSGRVLLEKNATRKLPPASLTKIMTAVVALESASLMQTVPRSFATTRLCRRIFRNRSISA